MADDLVRTRPGGEPPVVAAADDEQDRRALEDLVLDLPAQAHPSGGLGLAVEDGHVDVDLLEALEDRGGGRALHELDPGHVGRGAAADRETYLLADGSVVAVDEDAHQSRLVGSGVRHDYRPYTGRGALCEPIASWRRGRQGVGGCRPRRTPLRTDRVGLRGDRVGPKTGGRAAVPAAAAAFPRVERVQRASPGAHPSRSRYGGPESTLRKMP